MTLLIWILLLLQKMHTEVVCPCDCDPVLAAELGICIPPGGGSGGGGGGGW